MDKIDILVVTFNQEKFILECINSILNQTYKNISIKVFDDCSTDSTSSLLKKIKDPRIELHFSKSNLGVTENHNRALSSVSTKYFILTGGDDIFYNNKVEIQYNFLKKNKSVAFCGHNLNVINSFSEKIDLMKTNFFLRSGRGYKKWLNNGMLCGALSIMYNKEYIDNKYDVRLKYASDWKLIIDILKENNKFKVLNKILGAYRRHNNNLTSIKYQKCVDDQLEALIILKNDGLISLKEYKKSYSYYYNYGIYNDYIYNKSGKKISLKIALINLFKFGMQYRFINIKFYIGLFKLIFKK